MTNIMMPINNEIETKRFREIGRRLFIIPFSEKQNIHEAGEFPMDA